MKYNFPKIPLLFSILFLIASIFSFYFLYSKIKNDDNEAGRMLSEWQTGYKEREDNKLLNNFLKKTVDERALLNSHFAQSSDVVPFLDMLEDLASLVGAKAEVLVINVPSDNNGLHVEVQATGSFEAVYKFIKLLENSPYETEIIYMNLTKVFENKTVSEWNVNLKIKLISFIK